MEANPYQPSRDASASELPSNRRRLSAVLRSALIATFAFVPFSLISLLLGIACARWGHPWASTGFGIVGLLLVLAVIGSNLLLLVFSVYSYSKYRSGLGYLVCSLVLPTLIIVPLAARFVFGG